MIGSRKVIRDQDQYGQRKGSRSGMTHSKIPTDRIFLQPARLLVGDKDQATEGQRLRVKNGSGGNQRYTQDKDQDQISQ